MKTKNVLLIVLALILGVILGYYLGMAYNPSGTKTTDSYEVKKQFVKELRNKGFISPVPKTVNEVSGEIKQIESKALQLKTEQHEYDPLREFIPETVTVTIGEGTEIVRIKQKSPEVINQEEEEFNEKMQQYEQSGKEEPADLTSPQLFSEKKIKFSELNKEQSVTVETEQDVTGKSEFKAATIQVQSEI